MVTSRPAESDKLRPFISLGFYPKKYTNKQAIGDCIFCGKVNKFYVNTEDGRWDCKVCTEHGNVLTFYTQIFNYYKTTNFTQAPWSELADNRKLTIEQLQREELVWDGTRWLVGYRGVKGKIVSLSQWIQDDKGKFRLFTLKGMTKSLYGIYELSTASKRVNTIYVCEGEWDYIAIKPFLSENEIAIAVPGAGILKEEWKSYFSERDIVLCYDNDKAAINGKAKAYNLLKEICTNIVEIHWPKWLPPGYDIRDWLCVDKRPWEDLQNLIEEYKSIDSSEQVYKIWEGVPPDFDKTLSVFNNWLEINPTIEAAIRVSFAVTLSISIQGDPLWLFLVGPPGSAKTEILNSMRECTKAYYLSSCSPASLVSGANIQPDPSILKKADGKCLVYKDWTEILGKPIQEAAQIDSIFRGAYDGSVEREYGQGKVNRFNTRFAFLAGVTPIIRSTTNSSMGERTLLFNIYRGTEDSDRRMVESAFRGGGTEEKMRKEIQSATVEYIERLKIPENPIEIPERYVEEFIALATMVSRLRACVLRDSRDPTRITIIPFYEIATRLAKEFKKLAQALALHEPDQKINERVMSIVRKCARDTCNELHLYTISAFGQADRPLERTELQKLSKLPTATLLRVMEDMTIQGIIEKNGEITNASKTPPTPLWQLTEKAYEWARAAGLYTRENIRNGFSENKEIKKSAIYCRSIKRSSRR